MNPYTSVIDEITSVPGNMIPLINHLHFEATFSENARVHRTRETRANDQYMI